jgi:predicted kinase
MITTRGSDMATLTITRGLPGSGKTTWARQLAGAVRVNRDDLRRMLHGGHIGLGWAEVQVTIAQQALIEALLRAGVNVISDDTNLTGRAVGALTKIATDCGANVVIKDFREVPLEVCIERDAQRDEDSRVGEAAIRDMHRRYIARRPVTRE